MERVDVSLLAIAGGSGSGKDTVVDELKLITPEPFATLDFDDYFLGTKRLRGKNITDWESPALYRYSDYLADLRSLREGRPIEVECHSRRSVAEGVSSRVITPARWVIVYGFLSLYEDATAELFDKMIFIDIPEDEMVKRRIARTKGTEGWDNQGYIQSMLIPGHRKYVLPQRDREGVVVLDGILPSRQLAIQILGMMK